jgi:predicted methyltransferase
MHKEAHDFIAAHGTTNALTVVEFGSRNINGGVRDVFPNARYIGIDIEAGDGVDEVGDAASWSTRKNVDVVVCCEVFEHTDVWYDIVQNAYDVLCDGGVFLVTAANLDRAPHSAVDGGPLRDGEWYENVDPDALQQALLAAGFETVDVIERGDDVYAKAVKA